MTSYGKVWLPGNRFFVGGGGYVAFLRIAII